MSPKQTSNLARQIPFIRCSGSRIIPFGYMSHLLGPLKARSLAPGPVVGVAAMWSLNCLLSHSSLTWKLVHIHSLKALWSHHGEIQEIWKAYLLGSGKREWLRKREREIKRLYMKRVLTQALCYLWCYLFIRALFLGSGPTLLASFNLDYLLLGLILKCSHTGVWL